jgi:Zn-finger nucleic acid-binding protein
MQGAEDTQDAELARITHEAAAHARVAAPANVQGRACPACGAALSAIPFAGVVVDSCAAHGTFFDRSEVEQVVLACRKFRDAQAHENDPTLTGVAEDASAIVAGTAGLAAGGAFRLVVNVLEALFTESQRDRDRDRYYHRLR